MGGGIEEREGFYFGLFAEARISSLSRILKTYISLFSGPPLGDWLWLTIYHWVCLSRRLERVAVTHPQCLSRDSSACRTNAWANKSSDESSVRSTRSSFCCYTQFVNNKVQYICWWMCICLFVWNSDLENVLSKAVDGCLLNARGLSGFSDFQRAGCVCKHNKLKENCKLTTGRQASRRTVISQQYNILINIHEYIITKMKLHKIWGHSKMKASREELNVEKMM